MRIEAKEKKIIDLLLNSSTYLAATEIAEELEISVKTVYRTINKLNTQVFNDDVIVSFVGKGFQLDYEKYIDKQYVKNENFRTPNQRRQYVMLILLFKSPNLISIEKLFKDYYLGDSSIINDIKIIDNYMTKRSLAIEKNKEFIKVTGNESTLRKAINEILLDIDYVSDYSEVLEEISNNKKDSEDIKFITQQINLLEEGLGKEIPYPYDINLVIHIYILIKRFREGNVQNRKAEKDEKIFLPSEVQQLVCQCIENIGKHLDHPIPHSEYIYLSKYISSAGLVRNISMQSVLSEEMTNFYLDEYSLNVESIIERGKIHEDLILHIQPMVYRIIHDIKIKNTLLSEIKTEYNILFNELKKITKKAEKKFDLSNISDDEVGYLVVYFAKYMELFKKKKKNILIVCSSGVGTSEFLKVKVSQAFSTLNIVGVLSARKVEKEYDKYRNVDLILTTINLKGDIQIPSILVSSLFTLKDQERVQNFFEGELIK